MFRLTTHNSMHLRYVCFQVVLSAHLSSKARGASPASVKQMNQDLPENLDVKFKILNALGWRMPSDPEILDFGCGFGRSVKVLRDAGYNAWGCDIKIVPGPNDNNRSKEQTRSMIEAGLLRLIQEDPYRLPFDDDSFDFVFSEQVFEHVHNYPEAVHELRRIIKPGGSCLHFFPSRYQLFERHIWVPLAGVITSYPWLRFWAMLGLRTRNQRGLSAGEVAQRNYTFLRDRTNYLPKRLIRAHFEKHFASVEFAESRFLEHSKRAQKFAPLIRWSNILPATYSTFRNRVVFAANPR